MAMMMMLKMVDATMSVKMMVDVALMVMVALI